MPSELKSVAKFVELFSMPAIIYVIQTIFNPLTKNTGITEYIISEFGIALLVTSLIVAYLFWNLRAQLADIQVFCLYQGKPKGLNGNSPVP